MDIDFEELAAVCSYGESGDCEVLIENDAVLEMDDPNFESQGVECCEENCPLKTNRHSNIGS